MTVEYGLIGPLETPKIYGAGLLSSIGESVSCMQSGVKKLPYTIEALNCSYDITKTQPQLFVTPTFQNLVDVLETFANTMAFRVGGLYGLQKAIESKNVCTAVYSSGLQVTGTFTSFNMDADHQPVYIKTTGPTALSIANRQIKGHDKDYHRDGFSSPVGKLMDIAKALEDLTITEMRYFDIEEGKHSALVFESGVAVSGTVKAIITNNNKIQLITFDNCTARDKQGNLFFEPSWGVYDMAVGEKIVSVFCGAADKDAFVEIPYKSKTETHHPVYDPGTLELHMLYQQVRDRRHKGGDFGFLGNVWLRLQKNHHDDWLCPLEILEILEHEDVDALLAREIRTFLEQKANDETEFKKLISDGLYLIENPVEQKLVV